MTANIDETAWIGLGVGIVQFSGNIDASIDATDGTSDNVSVSESFGLDKTNLHLISPDLTVDTLVTKSSKPTLTGTVADASLTDGVAGVKVAVNEQTDGGGNGHDLERLRYSLPCLQGLTT